MPVGDSAHEDDRRVQVHARSEGAWIGREGRGFLQGDSREVGGELLPESGGYASSLVRQALSAQLPLLLDDTQPQQHQYDARKQDGDEKERNLPAMPVSDHDADDGSRRAGGVPRGGANHIPGQAFNNLMLGHGGSCHAFVRSGTCRPPCLDL